MPWVILDTSVVHETVKGRNASLAIDLDRLAALGKQTSISLSLITYFELVQQLVSGRLPFERWRKVAPALEAALDEEVPLVPLWTGLRVLLGTDTRPTPDVEHEFGLLRATSHVLMAARRPEDLRHGRRFTYQGARRFFNLSFIERQMQDIESRWSGIYAEVTRTLGRPVLPGDRAMLECELRRVFADVARVPELETAIQVAVSRVLEHGHSLRKGTPYRPTRNDAADFQQLFFLGLPGILCTSDARLRARVRGVRSPGADRVLSPAELLTEEHTAVKTYARDQHQVPKAPGRQPFRRI